MKKYTEYAGAPEFLSAPYRAAGSEEKFFDLLEPTILGLLDDLVPGSDLANKFLSEYEHLKGVWVCYPRKNHFVKFAPPFWHRLALLVRNSTLLRDEKFKKSWLEIREIFDNVVVAVAGCSVGNNVAHAVVQDLRPNHIKIADHKAYHITNGNRVRLTYEDFARNKAVVTAEQIHALDPFIKVSVFESGVHDGCINDFIAGNPTISEPRASVLVEETDDPDMKIMMREYARKNKVPVIMVTDIGSAVQLDIRRFDLSDSLPLAACGISDDELYAKRNRWQKDLANRDRFHEFAFALMGYHYRNVAEFKRIIHKEDPPVFGGIPQLGSTVMSAGGIAAEAIARLMLGYQMPERVFFHKHTGQVIISK